MMRAPRHQYPIIAGSVVCSKTSTVTAASTTTTKIESDHRRTARDRPAWSGSLRCRPASSGSGRAVSRVISGVLRAAPETAGDEPVGEDDQEQEQEAGDDDL